MLAVCQILIYFFQVSFKSTKENNFGYVGLDSIMFDIGTFSFIIISFHVRHVFIGYRFIF